MSNCKFDYLGYVITQPETKNVDEILKQIAFQELSESYYYQNNVPTELNFEVMINNAKVDSTWRLAECNCDQCQKIIDLIIHSNFIFNIQNNE